MEQESRRKIKAKRPAGFWKAYRQAHKESSERNREMTRLRIQLLRSGLQRQLDIVQVYDPPEYFVLFQGFATSHRCLIEKCRAKKAS